MSQIGEPQRRKLSESVDPVRIFAYFRPSRPTIETGPPLAAYCGATVFVGILAILLFVASAGGAAAQDRPFTGKTCMECQEAEPCYACHDRSDYEQPVVHAVLQGKDACSSCHLPHGSDDPDLLVLPKAELCASCHDPRKKPFESAHFDYPVATVDCTGCHDPHASAQAKLMRSSAHAPVMEDGCDTCHEDVYAFDPFAPIVDVADLCVVCHDSSDLADGGTHLHVPFEFGLCTSCHDPHASDQDTLLVAPGNDLCINCHLGHGEQTGITHGALQLDDGCLTCHDPHRSLVPGLLTARVDQVCYECHSDSEIEFAKGNVHAPVRDGSCTSCHLPHGSEAPNLLKAEGDELCVGCHEGLLAEDPPSVVHVPFEKQECMSCHDPHVSSQPGLIIEKEDAASSQTVGSIGFRFSSYFSKRVST